MPTFSNSFSWTPSFFNNLSFISGKGSPYEQKKSNRILRTFWILNCQFYKLTFLILKKKGMPNVEKTSLWKCATGTSISSSFRFNSSFGISSILYNLVPVAFKLSKGTSSPGPGRSLLQFISNILSFPDPFSDSSTCFLASSSRVATVPFLFG